MKTLEILVLDNGVSLQCLRTQESLQHQTDTDFFWHTIPLSAFFGEKHLLPTMRGDYILFLYGGSVLTEDAVAAIRQAIYREAADWYYFDEKVFSWQEDDPAQWRREKPEFSQLNFLAAPYIGEGLVFSRSLLQKMQLSYSGYSFTAAITEMALAAASYADGIHLPHLLLQRYIRMPLLSEEIQFLSGLAGKCHRKLGLPFVAQPRQDTPGLLYHPTPAQTPDVSMIVLCRSEALPANPSDSPYEWIFQRMDSSYLHSCLQGAQKAHGQLLCFLSDSVAPSANGFSQLISYAFDPQVGMVSPCLCGTDEVLYAGVFSSAGRQASFPEYAPGTQENRETALPAWQLWLIRREVWDRLDFSSPDMDSADYAMVELAAQCRELNLRNMYIGSVSMRYTPTAELPLSGSYSRMLLRRKAGFFLDPLCPAPLKSLLRRDILQNMAAYYPRDIAFSPGKKTMLVLSHELSLTGAPVVLAQATQVLRQDGWQIVVASPQDGVLRHDFLRQGIPVLVLGEMSDTQWIHMAASFDMVLVNTIVPYPQIDQLREASVPVMWWLHDARSGYQDFLRFVLPETVGSNIHIYSVSGYADQAVQDFRPAYPTKLLLYGLNDDASVPSENPLRCYAGKSVFINVGTISRRKGQDIMAQAIRLLPENILENCVFLFAGKCLDTVIYQPLLELKQDFPQQVELIDSIPRSEILSLYHYASGVVCSSRDDPLPTFMAETMMMSGVCICSENTGTAPLIQHGISGYLYHEDDPQQLANCIEECFSCRDSTSIRAAARRIFEEKFSMDIFRRNLLRSVADCLDERKG